MDSAPDRIVANEMRRDHFNISRGASFAVALDTFYDRRNAFYFETNPLGAIRDGLITNESGAQYRLEHGMERENVAFRRRVDARDCDPFSLTSFPRRHVRGYGVFS